MLFEKIGVDLKATYKEFYEKYKVLIGSAHNTTDPKQER